MIFHDFRTSAEFNHAPTHQKLSPPHLSITIPIRALPKTPPTSNVVENMPAWALVYFSCKTENRLNSSDYHFLNVEQQ